MVVGPVVSSVLYAEDLRPGDVFELGSTTVDKDEILEFGRRFDPLPLHTDEDAAAASRFGGLIASGFHTVAVLQRLLVDAVFSRSGVIAGREIDSVRMRAPVRPGDMLHGTMEIVEIRHATTAPPSSTAGAR
ncbi:acyl dehydratase [Streptomyces canus]|nr:acyl dehydratase [Streptomyces canus]